ncbi:MAG: caspase family protein [Myxococcaceae bacterium]|nr:caspase family protein [Myxococcaceae bacterium]
MNRWGVLACLLALSALAETRRVAVVVGNNAGNGDLAPLRYAESDAGKMARVLVELGEVSSDDVLLLQGRPVAELERALADARDRVASFKKNPDTRVVLLFYFSGHSDGDGLEMGGTSLAFARLKALLAGTAADVRLTIVDACKSGAGLKEKGLKPTEAFVIKLSDTLNATGEAFITSSAADESALESSEVMGSLFTHNLISGLRGAADSSGDKLVTLSEAYRYAYERTVTASAILPAGAQHPNYDYRLSGQGELVLATLLKPSASLVLPEGLDRALVTDLARDQVVVEIPAGPVREVALAAGRYGVRVFKGAQSFGGRFTLADGARQVLTWNELTPVTSSVVVAKKGSPVLESTGPDLHASSADEMVLTATFGAVPAIANGVGLKGQLRVGFEPHAASGIAFSLLGDTSFGGDTITEAGLHARVGYRLVYQTGPLWLGGGAEAGPAVLWQVSPADGLSSSVAGVFAPRVGARLRLGGPVSLMLDGEVAVMILVIDRVLAAVAKPSATFGVAFSW